MKLSGNTILITGGTSGIGLAFAKVFVKLGNKVIVTGRNEKRIARVLQENPGLLGVASDVSNPDSVRQLTKYMKNNYPELNLLFNSAGIMREHDLFDESIALENLTSEIDTNLKGTIWATKALLPILDKQPESMIVNVSSGLSFIASVRTPIYSPTKSAVHFFSDALRIQISEKKKNIHVMELIPPLVAETNLESLSEDDIKAPNMSLETLVKHGINGISKNKKRVTPGLSKVLKIAGKFFPEFFAKATTKANSNIIKEEDN